MHIIRNKEGNIIALSSKKEDAINIADKKMDKADYILEEILDSIQLREIYRIYYGKINND
jgi:hypothetical protein